MKLFLRQFAFFILVTMLIGRGAATVAGELSISIDFPSGSGKLIAIDQQRRAINIRPTPHPDRGWDCWWYVKIDGIRPGETIELTVGDPPWAVPDRWATSDRAAFSTDNQVWRQTEQGKRSEPTITYRQQVDAETCWFAWGPPFTPKDAQQLVDKIAKNSPHAEAFELCRTRHGRAVPALHVREENPDIADPQRHGIWIQARQHAWESGSSWVGRGFAQWLVSDDPRAKLLRRSSDIYFVPVMDIDNVAIGAGGKNQKPQDHNRDWSDKPHWNAVRAAIGRITAMDKDKRFDLFIDLHNPGAITRNPFFFTPLHDALSNAGQANLARFLASARMEMTGPLAYLGETKETGAGYAKRWRQISRNWVVSNTQSHVVAVTLETAWNTPHSTSEGYMQLGRELGLAVERYFRTRVATE